MPICSKRRSIRTAEFRGWKIPEVLLSGKSRRDREVAKRAALKRPTKSPGFIEVGPSHHDAGIDASEPETNYS